jgi:2-keto-4-pentenoate hydratase/2-oxohepta-3-ene-1,7-dioic acid hydratase in catechol pathway
MIQVPWSRLIRFVSDDGKVHFGDANAPSSTDIGSTEYQKSGKLTAKLIEGDPLSSDCRVLHDKTLPVVKLLGPLSSNMIPSIRCIGLNYKGHRTSLQNFGGLLAVIETGQKFPRFPIMFPKTDNTIADYGAAIEIPAIAQDDQADYEGELVVVIGKDAKNVPKEKAMEYVLGYTVADDVSARFDRKLMELMLGNGKWTRSWSERILHHKPVFPKVSTVSVQLDPALLLLRSFPPLESQN